MLSVQIVYYAHSIEIYDTRREQEELQRLEKHFSDTHTLIFNPNRPSIQFAENPMRECIRILKSPSITGIAFSHKGHKIPLGVYREIQLAQKYHKAIWIINDSEIHKYVGKTVEIRKNMSTNWAKV